MSQPAVLLLSILLLPSTSVGQRHRPTDEYNKTCNAELDAGEVLHEYKTNNFGCLLICHILSPSSAKYSEFLNHFAVKTHYLSGRQCINETYVSEHRLHQNRLSSWFCILLFQVCINGTCIINPLKVNPLAISLSPFPGNDINGQRVNPVPRPPTAGNHGNVSVKFSSGHIALDDNAFSKGDPYVKYYVNNRFVDRTATRYNTYYPKFNENFVVNSLTRMDILKFEVWNENPNKDDYIFSITTTCDEILSKRMNQKKRTHNSGLVNRLVLTITCAGFN